ncbi:MAG: hypothetical protein DRP79_07105, partial [Planctomycetota bacterium]
MEPKPALEPKPSPGPKPEPTFADIVARVKPSVVTIRTESGSSGSGFVIDSRKALIATNRHVIAGAQKITVCFHDGISPAESLQAGVKLIHATADIAIIQVKLGRKLPPALCIGKTDVMREGEDVFTIGSPGGIGRVLEQTVTKGIISSAQRKVENTTCFQIDAPVNPGNSG